MANTATLKFVTPRRLGLLLTGDGTVAGPTIANATLLGYMIEGSPLYQAWNRTYATQAAMQTALLIGSQSRMSLTLMATGVDVTAESNQPTVNVDADAVTATKAEINITMSDTTGQLASLLIEYVGDEA